MSRTRKDESRYEALLRKEHVRGLTEREHVELSKLRYKLKKGWSQ